MLNVNHDTFIVGGSVLLLSHELNQCTRGAVLDSTLYMQLASGSSPPSLTEYEQWWERYRSQLNQFGWSRLQDFGSSFKPDPGSPGQVISEVLAAKVIPYLSSTYVDTIGRALTELSRLSPQSEVRAQLRQYSVAEDRGSNLTRVRSQVGIVLAGTRLIYLSFSFATSETLPDLLIEHVFRTGDIVGEIEFNGCVSVLDLTDFEPWRRRIAAAVAADRDGLITAVHS